MTDARPQLERVVVVSNDRLTEGVGLISLEAPRCAHAVRPGQFVHLRTGRDTPAMLRRPFSVHAVSDTRIEILYQTVGAGTARMAFAEPGDDTMDVVGPLGHGWEVSDTIAHALFVTGGLGAAPLGMLATELAERGVAVVVAMGAPTSARLVAREHFDRVVRTVELATDDGSAGHPGFVTEVSGQLLREAEFDAVYTCGPEPMQRIVAEQAASAGVPCQVSLERLMACGIGACLSCTVETTSGQKRACVDGPVFRAEEVVW